jgi:hypothetical protein
MTHTLTQPSDDRLRSHVTAQGIMLLFDRFLNGFTPALGVNVGIFLSCDRIVYWQLKGGWTMSYSYADIKVILTNLLTYSYYNYFGFFKY